MKKLAAILILALAFSACAQAQENNSGITETVMNGETTSLTETEVTEVKETTVTVTETTTAETTTVTEITEPKEIMYINSEGVTVIDLELLSEEYTDNTPAENSGRPILVENCGSDNILVYFKGENSWYGYISDISDGSLKSLISEITEYGDIDFAGSTLRGGRCFYYFGKTEKGTISEEKMIEISEDGSYGLIDEIPANRCGNHGISGIGGSIIDDDSGEVLVPAYIVDYDENGEPHEGSKQNTYYSFDYAVDENRFLYEGFCYEWTTGLRIYDFETKTAYDIPDSHDTIFLGAAREKIFFCQDEMNGNGRTIYSADISDLNNIVTTDITNELISGYGVSAPFYYFPDNRQIIGAALNGNDEYKPVLFDLESMEIVRELPDCFFRNMQFTDNFIYSVNYGDNELCIIPRSISDENDTFTAGGSDKYLEVNEKISDHMGRFISLGTGNYDDVQSRIITEETDAMGQSTEGGGFVTYKTDEGEILRYSATLYGETGRSEKNYYIIDESCAYYTSLTMDYYCRDYRQEQFGDVLKYSFEEYWLDNGEYYIIDRINSALIPYEKNPAEFFEKYLSE